MIDYQGARCRSIFFLALSFFLSFAAQAQLRQAPIWVSNLPVTDDAFYGLGVSDTKEDSQFRTKARKIALREISEKIYVSVNSASELTLKYENDEMEYLLDETVAMESTNFLSGHQKVDDWTDQRAKKYYVLYKLDRLTYLDNRRTYFQGVEDLVRLKRAEAEQLFDTGELVRGINKLVDALVLLDKEMDRLVEPEFFLSLQKLQLHTKYELEKQVSRIELRTGNTYTFQADEAEPLIIEDFVIDRVTARPVGNLKTKLKVLKGDVFHYAFNQQGNNSELAIYGFYPEDERAVIQVEVELPLPPVVRESIDNTIRNRLVSKPITLNFKAYPVWYDHQALDEKGGDPLLAEFLRSITGDLGIEESKKDKAFYHITTSSKKSIIDRFRGLYTASYEAEVVVTRASDGEEVYRYEFQPRQARASKAHNAITEAYQKTINENNRFLVSFVTFLCTKPGE